MMDRNLVKIFAIWCIQLLVIIPAIFASTMTINSRTEVSPNEIIVRWNTTRASNATLSYFTDRRNVEHEHFEGYELSREHTFTNLEEGKRYTYEIRAFSEPGDQGFRYFGNIIGSFIVPDGTPPLRPVGLETTLVDEDIIEIKWEDLKEQDVTDVEFYMIFRNGENIENTTRLTFKDTELEPLTTYLYEVAGKDYSGNIGEKSDALYVTTSEPDLIPPGLFNISRIILSNSSVALFWNTDKEGDSRVYYWKDNNILERRESSLRLNHTVTLTGLEYGRSYSYIVSSCDRRKNCRNSSIESFVAGGDTEPPKLDLKPIPEIYNANRLTIEGKTDPLTRVMVYVTSMDIPSRVTQANIFGDFKLDVFLDVSKEINNIKVRAEDGMRNFVEEYFEIRVDTEKPVVNLSEIPPLTMSSSLSLNGTISEDVTLRVFVRNEDDPSQTVSEVKNLSADAVESNMVRLSWSQNPRDERIDYYRIYRNGQQIGISRSNSYTDCVNASERYTYQVSAINQRCREGQRSNTLFVETPEGLDCDKQFDYLDRCRGEEADATFQLREGVFRQSVTLLPGTNYLRLSFTDIANNTVDVFATVIYDEKEPSIIWHNLRDLTPAYDDKVTVKGGVDEPAIVHVIVNGDQSYITKTQDDGNFSVEVRLERINFDIRTWEEASRNQVTGQNVPNPGITGAFIQDFQERQEVVSKLSGMATAQSANSNYFSYQQGNDELRTTYSEWVTDDGVYVNNIRIKAIDLVGRESVGPVTTRGEIIEYRMCSFGNWWSVQISDPQPSMLLPRHLIKGIAQINFNYQLEWVGGNVGFEDGSMPRITSLNFNFREVSGADQKDWDIDWFRRPRVFPNHETNRTTGYVVVSANSDSKLFRSYANTDVYRTNLNRAVQTDTTDDFVTTVDMENNISRHRSNEDPQDHQKCMIPQFGCVRLPLELTISFTDPVYASDAYSSDTSSGRVTQRQCLNIEVAIDKRIDPNIIPRSFLESSIKFLTSAIEFIDTILEPINTIKEYTLYGCMGSWVYMYFLAVRKSWSCEFGGGVKGAFTNIFSRATGSRGGITPIAEQGLCEYYYCENWNKDAKQCEDSDNFGSKYDACDKCKEAIIKYEKAKRIQMNLCDRLGCPSAPSFMSYVRQAQNQRPQQNVIVDNTTFDRIINVEIDSSNISVINLVKQSDCANFPITAENIEIAYAIWKTYKERGEDAIKFTNPFFSLHESSEIRKADELPKVSCFEPHAENPYCCVVEYMLEYDSVCGLSMPTKGVLLDEMKESYCVALKDSNLMRSEENIFEISRPGEITDENSESKRVLVQMAEGLQDAKEENMLEIEGGDILTVNYQSECQGFARRTWNIFAEICEKRADVGMELVNTRIQYISSINQMDFVTRNRLAQEETGTGKDNPFKPQTSKTSRTESVSVSQPGPQGGVSADGSFAYDGENGCPTRLDPKDNPNIYYRILPNSSSGPTMPWTNTEVLGRRESDEVLIERGMIVTRYSLLTDTETSNLIKNSVMQSVGRYHESDIGSNMRFVPLKKIPVEWFRNEPDHVRTTDRAADRASFATDGFQNFKNDLEKCAQVLPRDAATQQANMREVGNIMAFLDTQTSATTFSEINRNCANHFSADSGYICNNLRRLMDRNKDLFINKSNTKNINKISENRKEIETYLQTSIANPTGAQISQSEIRAIYEEIRNKIGIQDKPIIVDPTSSIFRSFQCLCLPAITSFLKLWRAIFTAVRACFQTILMTGDGNPGICRTVLSVYVCDLIYDAISCMSNHFRGSNIHRAGGILDAPGNVIGAMSSAGRQVQSDVSSRYGDKGFYRAMFGERQLVHAICLWAFTGTFDLDFKAIVQGEYGDVPIDSQVLIAPCERRFISYDSSSGGRTTHSYYFGVGIVAGADLNYRVQLKCSDGFDCDYGMGQEECDCNSNSVSDSIRTRNVRLTGTSSTMNRFDVLEEEFEQAITSDVRYDKIVVEYSYMNKDRQRVTKTAECNIRQRGGLPPGFCQFYPGQGIYRCSVEMGSESFAQLTSVVDLLAATGYRPGQSIVLNAHVTQQLPSDGGKTHCLTAQSCEYTKYLGITLKDHRGKDQLTYLDEVAHRPVLSEGSTVYSIPTNYIIPPELILGTSLECGIDIMPVTGSNNRIISGCTGNFGSTTDSLVLNIGNDRKISSGGVCKTTTNPEKDCEVPKVGTNQITCSCPSSRFPDIRFTVSPVAEVNHDTARLRPRSQLSDFSTNYVDICGGQPHVFWTYEVALYDALDGGMSISNNIYKYQGREQKSTGTIKINCRDAETSSEQTAAPITNDNAFSRVFSEINIQPVVNGGSITNILNLDRIICDPNTEYTFNANIKENYRIRDFEIKINNQKHSLPYTGKLSGSQLEISFRIEGQGIYYMKRYELVANKG